MIIGRAFLWLWSFAQPVSRHSRLHTQMCGLDLSKIKDIDAAPLLVLGGLGASRLVDTEGTCVWPPTACNILTDSGRWRARMVEPDGVDALAFGDPDAFDLYPLFPFLVRTNYLDAIPRADIAHTIPYDFRRIHDTAYLAEFNERLQAYIESQPRPVSILAHSTGGIVVHWFLHTRSREWIRRYIKHVVYVGVPFAGLALTMAELVRPSPITRAVGTYVLSRIGGFALNLPDPAVLTHPYPAPDPYSAVLSTDDRSPLERAQKMYANTKPIRAALAAPPAVACTVIHGAGRLTLIGLSARGHHIYGVGDGVVPAASLAPPAAWLMPELNFDKTNQSTSVTVIAVPGASHTGILFSPELRRILRALE